MRAKVTTSASELKQSAASSQNRAHESSRRSRLASWAGEGPSAPSWSELGGALFVGAARAEASFARLDLITKPAVRSAHLSWRAVAAYSSKILC